MVVSIWEETLRLKNLKERKTIMKADKEEETINLVTINTLQAVPSSLKPLLYSSEDSHITQQLTRLNHSFQQSAKSLQQESLLIENLEK